MIAAAAVCPHTPLLVRELSGQHDVLPDLREACHQVVSDLIAVQPDRIVVLGDAEVTSRPVSGDLDVRGYGTFASRSSGVHLPLSLGVGKHLLNCAEWRGETEWLAVAQDLPGDDCAGLGSELAGAGGRTALLVMADGTGRRKVTAPGYFDERSHPFDEQVTTALAAGDSGTLRDLDAGLADELMMYGRAPLQVLAAAMPDVRAAGVRYADDPYGVFYYVALWSSSLTAR